MRLLLVEDDPVMSTTLARALERRGLRVAAVGDGLAALAHWQRHPPDAVLLDLSLPGLDGLQVLTQARAAGLRRRLPAQALRPGRARSAGARHGAPSGTRKSGQICLHRNISGQYQL